MKIKILYLMLLGFCSFSIILSSCTKPNEEKIEEKTEVLDSTIEITIRGNTTTYDAYAGYCYIDGTSAFVISNNYTLAANDSLFAQDFEENDFLIYYFTDGTNEANLSGTTFAAEINGEEFISTV